MTEVLQGESLSILLKIILIGGSQQDVYDSLKTYPNIHLDKVAFPKRLIQARAEQIVAELIEEKPFLLEFTSDLKQKLYQCDNFLQLSVTLDILTEHKETVFSSQKVTRSDLEALPYKISNKVILKAQRLPE